MTTARYAASVMGEVVRINRVTWPLFAERKGDGRILLHMAAWSGGHGIACGVLADYIDERIDCEALTQALRHRLHPWAWPMKWGRDYRWVKAGCRMPTAALLSSTPDGPAATLGRDLWGHWDAPRAGTITAGDWFTAASQFAVLCHRDELAKAALAAMMAAIFTR